MMDWLGSSKNFRWLGWFGPKILGRVGFLNTDPRPTLQATQKKKLQSIYILIALEHSAHDNVHITHLTSPELPRPTGLLYSARPSLPRLRPITAQSLKIK